MHRESLADAPETVEPIETESIKSSKLTRIKSAAIATAFYGGMGALTVGSMYLGFKMTKMQLETAKLALEAAKLEIANAATQQYYLRMRALHGLSFFLKSVQRRNMLPSQQALANFYHSVRFHNPAIAEDMADDINTVAIWGLGADKSGGQAAADRLREATRPLPEVFNKVLAVTLDDLGYS